MIGQTVSHYKILEKLGEGGMGVVYKAHDAKLERDVALKFLPSHLSASEQDKARFIQEAKAAATLSHPNICTIYSIEEHDSQLFIAMQLVDGQLLRDRMSGLSQKQALEIGIQVAEGLAAAHEKGVVHRDIKPENIMVRKDGIAQIMDFGLAKLKGVSRLTKEGSTVGTAGYMSPEQIQGQDADHRSDIFSLGVLLYEMLTGHLPFKGVHETAIAYEIVNVDAQPMAAVKPDVNPELDRIVLECLEKDPSERFQSTAEIAKELKRYKRESSRQRTTRTIAARQFPKQAGGEIPTGAGSRVLRFVWPVVSGVLLVALLTVILTRSADEAPDLPVMRFPINLPQWSPLVLAAATLAISPDGTNIAYLAAVQGAGSGITGLSSVLHLRALNDLEPKPIQGTEGASDPFFSPDGEWIGFFSGSSLKKVSIFGGAVQNITVGSPFMRGGWWSADNTIWFGRVNSGIYRVPVTGGTPEPATVVDSASGEISHRFPQLLPGDKWLLFTVKYNNISSFDEAAIVVENVETHERREVLRGGSYARYVSTGHIVYARNTSLHAVPFDLGAMKVTGPPLPVLEGGMLNPMSGTANFEFSRNGILVYATSGPQSGLETTLAWMDMNGKTTPLMTNVGPYDEARLSPDNSRIALTIRAANDDIWVYDIRSGTFTRLTFGGGNSGLSIWTPDGKRVLFAAERGTQTGLFWKPGDGSGSIERIGNEGSVAVSFSACFSTDGSHLIYGSNGDLREVSVDGKDGRQITQSPATEDAPRLSPDGTLLAYVSDESGRNEIYAVPYPSMNGKWQISTGGADSPPIWNPAGNAMYFGEEGSLFRVDVTGAPSPTFSRPHKVCPMPPSLFGIHDIARDGKRFLVTLSAVPDDPSMTQLNVVVGWFSELRRKFASLSK
jgi:serine/threonine-protein kinase